MNPAEPAEQVLVVRKLRAATVYQLLLLGLSASLVPLGFLLGVAGLFGADTVQWNRQPVHGLWALLAGTGTGLFVALFLTAFLGSLVCLGLWLVSRLRSIRIRVVVDGGP